jgi:hypothetical protein
MAITKMAAAVYVPLAEIYTILIQTKRTKTKIAALI